MQFGTPSFVAEKHGVHIFTWSTKHSCSIHHPSSLSTSNSGASILDNEDNSESLPNPDADPKDSGDDEEQELLDPQPSKTSRRWMAIMLFTTG